MIDIDQILSLVADDRPLFHSEADFQHALAWRIRQCFPDCGVRLEYRPPLKETMYLDLWLTGLGIAIELKYRTRKLKHEEQGELFALKDQFAQDVARYDFLGDINRLESLSAFPRCRAGFAVLLTNDHLYWSKPSRPDTVDKEFRLTEGQVLCGKMAWTKRAAAGTTKDREDPICLAGSYDAQWKEYSNSVAGRFGRFRYLAIEVTP